jgi:hypothetical protein
MVVCVCSVVPAQTRHETDIRATTFAAHPESTLDVRATTCCHHLPLSFPYFESLSNCCPMPPTCSHRLEVPFLFPLLPGALLPPTTSTSGSLCMAVCGDVARSRPCFVSPAIP